jgi:peptidoglycan-N-acetylglucosamine deacetylase
MLRYALTFDDGPGPETSRVLDLLAKYGVKATFFLLGRNIAEPSWANGDQEHARSIVSRMIRENHVLGNHTYSHRRSSKPDEFLRDVAEGERIIRQLYTAAKPEWRGTVPFRLPYGIQLNEAARPMLDPRLHALASMGKTHVHWTGMFGDWQLRSAEEGMSLAQRLIQHVMDLGQQGLNAVICLHDSSDVEGPPSGFDRTATVQATEIFLAYAKREGWRHFLVPEA